LVFSIHIYVFNDYRFVIHFQKTFTSWILLRPVASLLKQDPESKSGIFQIFLKTLLAGHISGIGYTV